MPNRYLWVSRREYLESHNFTVGSEGSWSCAKTTRKLDQVIMYEAGAKRFLWVGTALSNAGPDDAWDWTCDYRVERVFDPPVELSELTRLVRIRRWVAYRAHFQRRTYAVPNYIWNQIKPGRNGRLLGREETAKRVRSQEKFEEGFEREIKSNRRERSQSLVRAAKEHYGSICTACGFSFLTAYGAHGDGFIEIHHVQPVAKMKPNQPTRLSDVVPVCSNCHRMLHRGRMVLSVKSLKKLVARARMKLIRSRGGSAAIDLRPLHGGASSRS